MEEYLTCPYCGAERNSENDIKCPDCKRIYPDKEERLMGFAQRDIEAFIDKNAEYYIPVFKKNEGKKKFTGWNWAAAIFPGGWLFYRKMYKQGVLYTVITTAISIVLSVLILFGFSGTLSKIEQATADFESLSTTINELKKSIPLSQQSSDEQLQAALKARTDASNIVIDGALTISTVSLLTTLVVSIAIMILMGLYGNCIYYNHVRLNATRIRDGGTSVIGMIGALLLVGIATSLVEKVVNFLIGIIF